jgi:hypothetical protein
MVGGEERQTWSVCQFGNDSQIDSGMISVIVDDGRWLGSLRDEPRALLAPVSQQVSVTEITVQNSNYARSVAAAS